MGNAPAAGGAVRDEPSLVIREGNPNRPQTTQTSGWRMRQVGADGTVVQCLFQLVGDVATGSHVSTLTGREKGKKKHNI